MLPRRLQILVEHGDLSYWVDSDPSRLLEDLHSYSKLVFLCDSNTRPYADELSQNFQNIIIEEIPAGEDSKSFRQLEKSCENLVGKIDRKTSIVAVGGGVVGDFGGFLSAILLRGLDFFLVPTTLLSMVDSSIGGKTAINLKNGKNLVGSFVTPKGIWVNFKSLNTLPSEHFQSGFGEMLKHALLKSPELIEKTLQELARKDCLEELIFESIKVKKYIVEQDFKELGLRQCLNLGHTVGHALEMYYKLNRAHGLCVWEGLIIEHRIAELLGYIEGDWLDAIESAWKSLGYKSFSGDPKDLRTFLIRDKKNHSGEIKFSFCSRPGKLALFDGKPVLGMKPEKFYELLEAAL
ncbi:MAG: 3-dehydroquinate synthase family protein [bacterium]|nr:3-dehydroquinate synthase family protein [bacterium]